MGIDNACIMSDDCYDFLKLRKKKHTFTLKYFVNLTNSFVILSDYSK